MKKLVSLFCCILYIDSISHASPEIRLSNGKSSGEKVLVKALATVMGREKDKKAPIKHIQMPPATRPF